MTKVCKSCHIPKDANAFYKDKRVKDGLYGQCAECWQKNNRVASQSAQTKWRETHPEDALAKGRAWRVTNRKRSNAFSRKWARNHREQVKARQRRWVRENKARVALYAQERRAREAGASGTTTPAQLQARIDYYGGRCYICGEPFEAIDHVISLNKGGTNWPSNLRPICKLDNSSKGDKSLAEFQETRAEASA
jgi:HNH endonuclease